MSKDTLKPGTAEVSLTLRLRRGQGKQGELTRVTFNAESEKAALERYSTLVPLAFDALKNAQSAK